MFTDGQPSIYATYPCV